ncbi:hypothetical protein [Chitinophaga sp. YIM B06452]|uniref:hypothetical protein n=1 Tax=Chitinophaga sp. YIM B06452 TaxID=3082158 RepID=UPI0031FE7FB8
MINKKITKSILAISKIAGNVYLQQRICSEELNILAKPIAPMSFYEIEISLAILDQELFGIKRRVNLLINYTPLTGKNNDLNTYRDQLALANRVMKPMADLRYLATDKRLSESALVNPFNVIQNYSGFKDRLHEVQTLLITLDEHVQWFCQNKKNQIELLENWDETFCFSEWAEAIENAISELTFFAEFFEVCFST